MRYLLDTHTFIWLDSIPTNLSVNVASICKDPSHVLFLSIASVWEMQIKLNAGKLILPKPLSEITEWQQQNNSIQVLPVNLSHIFALEKLPSHHRDPFDRMLIVQAQLEDLIILSRDGEFAQYPIKVIW
jgi:PIN domain nuclease of toxin-antitoxin system